MNFKNNPVIFKHIVDGHQKFVDEWKASTTDHDFITQCMFQAIPTVFAKHSAERGGNVMGVENIGANSIMLLFDIAVKTADAEVRARALLKKYTEEFQTFAASQGGLPAWQYLNYADSYQVSPGPSPGPPLQITVLTRPTRTRWEAMARQTLPRSVQRQRSTTPLACSRLSLLVASRSQRYQRATSASCK